MHNQSPGRAGAFALLSVATLTIMVGSAIAPALPSIGAVLGMGENTSWLVTLPALGVILLGPLAGGMVRLKGARATLVLGLALYGGLGILGALLPTLWAVLADRFLLGGATALVMVAGTALIADFYEGKARLQMIARQGMAIEAGGIMYLAIGGTLASLGWAAPYGLYLLAWAYLVLVLAFVPRPEHHAGREERASGSSFAQVGDILLAGGLSMLVFFTAVVRLPVQLPHQGFTEAQSGYYLAFVSLVAVAAAGFMPRFRGRFGVRASFFVAFAAFAVAHLLYSVQSGLPLLLVAALFMGLGFGFSIPLASHEVVERSRPADRGRNLAHLSVAIFMGQFLSSFLEYAGSSASAVSTVAAILSVLAGLGYALASHRVSPHAPAT